MARVRNYNPKGLNAKSRCKKASRRKQCGELNVTKFSVEIDSKVHVEPQKNLKKYVVREVIEVQVEKVVEAPSRIAADALAGAPTSALSSEVWSIDGWSPKRLVRDRSVVEIPGITLEACEDAARKLQANRIPPGSDGNYHVVVPRDMADKFNRATEQLNAKRRKRAPAKKTRKAR